MDVVGIQEDANFPKLKLKPLEGMRIIRCQTGLYTNILTFLNSDIEGAGGFSMGFFYANGTKTKK